MNEKDQKKTMSEAIIVKGNKVLIGRKIKKGGFGFGKWVGFGGKLEKGESIKQAMIRETEEEAGIMPTKFRKAGILTFHYVDDPDMEVHYFRVDDYDGKEQDSTEMQVAWFELDKIPYPKMWPNDVYWMPMLLQNKLFSGEFFFNQKYEIIKHNIEQVSKLNRLPY